MGAWKDITTVNGGWSALAETVIRWALKDLDDKYLIRDRYFACKFFLDEAQKDLYTGLAPNMIRDWENAEPKAKKILETKFVGYDPNKKEK